MPYDPLLWSAAVSGGACLMWVGFLLALEVRREKAVRQFRGMLTILANTHRQGNSFEDAIGILADLGPDPARGEFRRLQQMIDAGAGRSAILDELACRLPCFESQYLAAALASQSEKPAELQMSLERLEFLRQNRRTSQAEVAAASRTARLWIRALLLSGPFLMTALVLLRPPGILSSLARTASTTVGITLLSVVIVSAAWLISILQKQDEAETVLD